MKKFSIFLYLKQGIKGVYKFKIQFYVIIILTFIASLILGISLSASTRIINNYKQVMSKMDKFDYVSSREVGTVNNLDLKSVPMMDFVDFQFLAKKFSDLDTYNQANNGVGYNFNLISLNENATYLSGNASKNQDQFSLKNIDNSFVDEYKKEYIDTFIAKSFRQTEVKNSFFNLLSSDSFLEPIFHYKYDEYSGKIEYKNSYEKYNQLKITNLTKYADFIDNSSIKSKVYKDFYQTTILALRTNFLNDLKDKKDYLKTTTYNKLFENNIINESNFNQIFNENNPLTNENISIYDLYLLSAFNTLIGQIINNTIDYVQHYIDLSIFIAQNDKENKVIDQTVLTKTFDALKNTNENPGFAYYDESSNDNDRKVIANVLYTYIFGNIYSDQKDYLNEDYKNKLYQMQYNVEENKYQLPYLQQIDLASNTLNENKNINYKNYYVNESDDNYERGIRGSLNQLVVSVDNKNQPTGNVIRRDRLKLLKLESETSTLNENLVEKNGFTTFATKNELNRNNIDNIKLFYLKNKIVAQASNVKSDLRAEMSFPDSQKEMKYRLIVLDDQWQSRLSIVSGNFPTASNEIIINPQFAKANNYKLGSTISIGGSTFVISGFGVDPLTFFPIADINIPVPNSKKSVIVYGTQETLAQVVTNDYAKYTSKFLYNFVTANEKNKSELQVLDYYSNMMSEEWYLYQSYNAKQEVSQNINQTNKSINTQDLLASFNKNFEEYKTFDSSNFAYNWTLAPKITKTFQIFSYLAATLIALIALAATLIAIKKTIQLNAGEISILKAMGSKNSHIAVSYLSYGIISSFIIVPIAWVISAFCQEAIVSLLISYAGGSYWQSTFDWEAILASFSIFGILTLGVSYLVAYLLVKKPVLEIATDQSLNKRNKFLETLKKVLTYKQSFSTKFSTELAINGFSKTLLTAITIFLNSFLISGVMSMPGVVKKTLNEYYKNADYSSSVSNVDVIGNAPFSKTALSPWNGVESYENNYIDTKGVLDSDIGLIGKSTSAVQPLSEHSVIPKILISEDKKVDNKLNYNWTYDRVIEGVKDENGNSLDNANIISYMTSLFGNNLVQMIGKSISIEDVQLLLEWIIHSDNPKYNDLEQRKEKILQVSSLLTNGLPPILKTLFANIDINAFEGTWKDKIISIILAETPAYVRNYVNQSNNRINQYRFGWDFNSYIPKDDSFYTKVVMNNQKDNPLVTGLDKTQSAYKISNSANNIFLSDKDIKDIENILYGRVIPKENLIINGIKVYDIDSKTLNIPVLANKQSSINYEFKDSQIQDVKTNVTRFTLTKDGINIPNSAWKYDDRDYQSYNNSIVNSQNKGWLDPASLSNSKFTYAPIFKTQDNISGDDFYIDGFDRYKKAKKIVDDAYGFYNLEQVNINDQEQLKASIRPYYQYDNVMLFIPYEKYDDFKNILSLGNNKYKDAWYGQVDQSQVPDDTINDWKNTLGYSPSSYLWIRPYSYYFEPTNVYSKPKTNLSGSETSNLTTIRTSFLEYAFARSDNPINISNNVQIEWNKISNQNVSKINLQKYDDISVYGDSMIVADQSLVNLINGYSTARYLPFDFSYEDKNNPSGQYEAGEGVNIDTYKINTPESQISESNKNNWMFGSSEEQKSVKPHLWYNGSYLNSKEPYFMSTQASFSMNPKMGDYSVNAPNNFLATTEIKDTKFISEEKNLVNQISSLIITIGAFFIAFTIIISTLSIILISDLYVNQYKKFMVVMKSMGYSNREIITYTFKFVTIFSVILFVLATALSYLCVYYVLQYVSTYLVSIPVGFMWWTPIVSSVLIVSSYVGAIVLTTKKIRTESPTILID
ncbi:ABC transporter permease [Spiroplasma tabanidicola]|uniref:ABC transporter permease n=1 Tax=Spiroplasma tabanidicola TaxID=324079 RepID=A0A6I6C9F1_9MOLU|nr:ABC transporter permease [Spiroplasma tabanidicola]QGS52079.1 ABC transporter permease [Spiroplasma tabanidicola]